jgi:uncharacterized protein (DUF2147 family)
MKKLITYLAAAAALAFVLSAHAQMTPVGTWQSVDDETGKPSAEIKVSDKGNGELVGIILKGLMPLKDGDDLNCSQCTDDRKDKPKLGMEIIRGAKQTAGTTVWEGGQILDPNKGKLYKLRLTPLEGGAKLQVRGYIGPFFRTQTWNRVNP